MATMNLLIILMKSLLIYLLIINNVSLASATTSGVYFSYDSTSNWKNTIKMSGDTSVYNGILQLTGPRPSYACGWATYSKPIALVDDNGKPASFLTHFSFIINTTGSGADGLAFFLSPYPHVAPAQSCGGHLGIFAPLSNIEGPQQVVAVEFDTYFKNGWDPTFYHVGIDVNSIYSAAVRAFPSYIMTNGTLAHAWVIYSAEEETFNVSLNYQGDSESPGIPILSYRVNLTQVLPNTVAVGFSAVTGATVEIHQILSWEFNSTFKSTTSHKAKSRLVLIIVLCLIGAGLILGGVGWFLVRRKRSLNEGAGDNCELPKVYSYKELLIATSNFASKNKLGEGGFGPVFKGYLRDSCDEVAVKHLKPGSSQGSKEFKSEVEILSRMSHPNLVELFGWCEENSQLLLVYKYMPNGSLNSLLFDRHRLLLWPKRYEIILDLADALCYLQAENECNKEVVHRDIKPDNVLLDSNLEAKLSDFGLARLVEHGLSANTTTAAGSWGYVAPELISEYGKSKPSTQSDIYSFGIVLLEIACGRRPIGLDLIRFVWEHYGRNEILKAADERLKGDYNAKEMERVMFVGLWCAHPVASERPAIRLARKALKFEYCKLPFLPNYPSLLSRQSFGRSTTTELSNSN